MNGQSRKTTQAGAEAVTRIEATRGLASLGLHELWQYRELLYFFLWREIKTRYRQMALGPLWILLRPLLGMVVFTVVFGKVAGIRTPNDLQPHLFYLTGLAAWNLFFGAATGAVASLVQNMNLLTKVYFPRLMVPISTAAANLIDFAVALAILVALMIVEGIMPAWTCVLLILHVALILAAALAIGLWLAAAAARFRDVSFGVNYTLQLALFACPIIYPLSAVPEKWQTLYRLNPLANAIDGCRWALFGPGYGQGPDAMLAVSAGLTLLALAAGALYFRRTEKTVVDLI